MSKKGRGRSLALEIKYLPKNVKFLKTNERKFLGVSIKCSRTGRVYLKRKAFYGLKDRHFIPGEKSNFLSTTITNRSTLDPTQLLTP